LRLSWSIELEPARAETANRGWSSPTGVFHP
jgi:hypothetical protein